MKTTSFRGRDFLAETDFSREEIEQVLELAEELKMDRAKGKLHDDLLRAKTLFMIFYNQSLRTRNSFEAGMTQLGGHAHYLDPDKIYTPAMEGREVAYSTERVSDVARVLDRMGDAIAIRCYGDPVDWEYGGAHAMLQEFARWSDIPVLNMEDDVYHPFQGLADTLTVKEKFGGFKGVKLHHVLGIFPERAQAARRAAIRHPVCHHDGHGSHPGAPARAWNWTRRSSSSATSMPRLPGVPSASPTISRTACRVPTWSIPKPGAPRPSSSLPSGKRIPKRPRRSSTPHKDWKCTTDIMDTADKQAIYLHCLPCDRGYEVANEVIDKTSGSGWLSAAFDEAENRLHVQKAVMALVM